MRVLCALFAVVAPTLAESRRLRSAVDLALDPRTIEDPAECRALCLPLQTEMSATSPNVFIFGDSVSQGPLGYLNVTRSLLQDEARVHSIAGFEPEDPLGVCGTSAGALQCLDAWLGEGQYDVISFNWGSHDMCREYYGDVSREDYVENLNAIYHRLYESLAENGKIVWHSTTPVPPAVTIRRNSDVEEFNELARDLFEQASHPPTVSDLYSAVVDACRANVTTSCFPDTCGCEQLMDTVNIHMAERGNELLGGLVAESIIEALRAE